MDPIRNHPHGTCHCGRPLNPRQIKDDTPAGTTYFHATCSGCNQQTGYCRCQPLPGYDR